MNRSYDGPPLDVRPQYITERPHDEGETVAVVDAELDATGEVHSENVPVPRRPAKRPDVVGQTTWDDWGWGG